MLSDRHTMVLTHADRRPKKFNTDFISDVRNNSADTISPPTNTTIKLSARLAHCAQSPAGQQHLHATLSTCPQGLAIAQHQILELWSGCEQSAIVTSIKNIRDGNLLIQLIDMSFNKAGRDGSDHPLLNFVFANL